MKKIMGILSFASLLIAGCAMQDQGGDPNPNGPVYQVNEGAKVETTSPTNGAVEDPSPSSEKPFFCCPVPCENPGPGGPQHCCQGC